MSLLVHFETVGHPEMNAVPLVDYGTAGAAAILLAAPATNT